MDQYRTSWGLVGPGLVWPNLTDFICTAAKNAYAGVEFPLAHLGFEAIDQETAIEHVKTTLDETGLSAITLIATRPSNYGNAADHLMEFRKQAEISQKLGVSKVVIHAGADSFDRQTALSYLKDATQIAQDCGLRPCFETHRGRLLNDPWRTADLLDALPKLELTLDVSHWHVAVDREPLDIMDLFDEAARRAGHTHARIGHEKSPQVPHPGDAIWESHVAHYKRWWTIARDAAEARGDVFTVAAEFGPPPYMNTRPFSHERDADLVELNRWMRERLDEWFGN